MLTRLIALACVFVLLACSRDGDALPGLGINIGETSISRLVSWSLYGRAVASCALARASPALWCAPRLRAAAPARNAGPDIQTLTADFLLGVPSISDGPPLEGDCRAFQ